MLLQVLLFLPARRCASAGTSYGPVSVPVCPVTSRVFCRNGYANRSGFRAEAFFDLSYTVER